VKIIKDTLQYGGKWSRKSLTMFTSMIASLIIGFYISFSNLITERPLNPAAIDVFQTFMVLVGTLSGITVWDKKQNNKAETNEN
jgi:hypothetical protein